jgi:hypothetical protein
MSATTRVVDAAVAAVPAGATATDSVGTGDPGILEFKEFDPEVLRTGVAAGRDVSTTRTITDTAVNEIRPTDRLRYHQLPVSVPLKPAWKETSSTAA